MNLILLFLALALAVTCLTLVLRVRHVARHLAAERFAVEKVRAQLAGVEAEALRLQTVRRDFVANISHELRTPLASIKLLVETLEEGALQDDAVAAQFTRKIGQETDHLIGMAQELLDLARLEAAPAMRPRALDAAALVTNAVDRVRELARDRQIALRTELPAGTPSVWADSLQIARVFVNLLENALKFTPRGGTVLVSARPEGRFLAFSIADTGPGIPIGEESRIFERFYKADAARQRGGTGLGLSIARHIVEAQGGHIWARNREDAGACFTFTVPMASQSGAKV